VIRGRGGEEGGRGGGKMLVCKCFVIVGVVGGGEKVVGGEGWGFGWKEGGKKKQREKKKGEKQTSGAKTKKGDWQPKRKGGGKGGSVKVGSKKKGGWSGF